MNQLKVSTRLNLMISVMALLLLLLGALGLSGISQSNAALKTVYEDRTVALGHIMDLDRMLLLNRVAIARAIAYPDQATALLGEVAANRGALTKAVEALESTSLTTEEEAQVKQLNADRKTYTDEAGAPILKALSAGDSTEARRIEIDKLKPLYGKIQDDVSHLAELQRDVARQEYEEAADRYRSERLVAIAALVFGIAFAVVFGWMLKRGIAGPLQQAVDLARSVADGDLSREVRAAGRDELAEVLQSLASMQEGLIRVVGSVRQGAEGVATASAEIAQGNQDLSARTENQASALEETASSMEELGSTVRQNADGARQANQLAIGASEVAVKGGRVVAEVVTTMDGISASSQKIADITNVIDGIAFQTNILALNAAVEAARAGEQGRGFAVVAGEVRVLAQRSAAAAKEIKALIQDSVERVGRGNELVQQAGQTMGEIVSSVRRVTDIMGTISQASTEQSAGVDQVGQAVAQMDQTTQQNAALVEQMAAAATSLRGQADELVSTVAFFRLR